MARSIKTRFKALLSNVFGIMPSGISADKFARMRVSQMIPQFDLKQLHDERFLLMDFLAVGTGGKTYQAAESSTRLECAANGDISIAQSFQRFNYSSGNSQFVGWTTWDFAIENDYEKRIGYFSSATTAPYETYDGFFLSSDETNGIGINVYKDGSVIEQVYQGNWSENQLSGVDWDNNVLILCDFAWFGIDGIRWFAKIGDKVIHFHTSKFSGEIKGVYMLSPNQPFRAEIRCVSAPGGIGGFNYTCAAVASEGDAEQIGIVLSDNQGNTTINASSTANKYGVVAVRLNSAKVDTLVDLLNFTLLGATNDDFLYEIWLNPTLASGSWSFNPIANSSVETAFGTTGGQPRISGGTLVDSGYQRRQTSDQKPFESAVRLGASIAGVSDIIAISVQPISNGLDIYGSITWREQV